MDEKPGIPASAPRQSLEYLEGVSSAVDEASGVKWNMACWQIPPL
jgi:hypothetical protein